MIEKEDLALLFSLACIADFKEPAANLSPIFYLTGTYEGDIDIFKQVREIQKKFKGVIYAS